MLTRFAVDPELDPANRAAGVAGGRGERDARAGGELWPPVGLVRLTVGGVLPVPPPLQVVPLRVNEVGLPLVPLNVPLKPTVNVAPVAMLPFQSALLATVTFDPDWVKVTGQPLLTC